MRRPTVQQLSPSALVLGLKTRVRRVFSKLVMTPAWTSLLVSRRLISDFLTGR